MLQAIKSHSKKLFFKIIFVVIAASFVMWGIVDIIQNYRRARPVALIGSEKIGLDEYRNKMHNFFKNAQSVQMSEKQKKEAYDDVLNSMIQSTAIALEIKKHHIIVPDFYASNFIKSYPQLQENGVFSQDRFNMLLRHQGKSEGMFFADIKKDIAIQGLVTGLIGIDRMPIAFQDILYKFMYNEHEFILAPILLSSIKIKQKPAKEELELLYKNNMEKYRVPEYRTIAISQINGEEILQMIPVSESDIQNEYGKRKESLFVDEKRHVSYVMYKSKSAAETAESLAKNGKSLATVSIQVPGGTYKDIGAFSEENLSKEFFDEFKKEIINLKQGETSKIVPTEEGYYIFHVDKITPPHTQTYKEVRKTLLQEIRMDKSTEFLKDFKDKLEDMLASGKSLQEVSKIMKFSVRMLTLDDHGLSPAKKNVFLDKESEDVKKSIMKDTFSLDVNQISPVSEVSPDEFLIVQVLKINPSHVVEFKKIIKKVKFDWEKGQKIQKANEIIDAIKKSKTKKEFIAAAAKHGITTTNKKLTRYELSQSQEESVPIMKEISQDLALQILQSATGKIVSGATPDGMATAYCERIVETSSDISKKDFNEKLQKIFLSGLQKDILNSFKKEYNIEKKEDVIKTVKDEDKDEDKSSPGM